MDQGNICPRCHSPLPAGTSPAACPKCLLQRGLEPNTVGYTQPEPARAGWEPPAVEILAAGFPELDIIELIGRGGMGAVYKVRERHLDRLVALKILPPEIGRDGAFAQRFTHEARAMAQLNHANIVTIHSFGQRGDLYYFLMEYVDGLSLRQLLAGGPVAAKEALAIVPQICDALQYAHDRGIVHSDIKPENILLNRSGQVKIADFGLAKLMGRPGAEGVGCAGSGPQGRVLHTGADEPCAGGERVMGTPRYMAPEQAEHPAEVDHRADIYSLGVVFYQMLTGELPARQLEPPSRKVVIDVRLDEVVLRALERQPERRYQQASEVKTRVETIVATAPEPSPSQPGRSVNVDADLTWGKRHTTYHRSIPMTRIARVVHWAARLGGTFWLAWLAERMATHAGSVLPPNLQVGAAGAMLWMIGCVLGWRLEGLAAILILLGSAGVYAAVGPAWLNAMRALPALVGVLYALSWWFHRPVAAAARPRGWKWPRAALRAGLLLWIAGMAGVAALAVKPVYRGEAFLVMVPPGSAPSPGQPYPKEVMQRAMRVQMAGISNEEVFRQAADALKPTLWYELHSQPGMNVVDELRRAIRIEPVRDAAFISVSATSPGRNEAALLANIFAEAAVESADREVHAGKLADIEKLQAQRDRLAQQPATTPAKKNILGIELGTLDNQIRIAQQLCDERLSEPLHLMHKATPPEKSIYDGLIWLLMMALIVLVIALVLGWVCLDVCMRASQAAASPTPPATGHRQADGQAARPPVPARQAVRAPAIGLLVAAGMNIAVLLAMGLLWMLMAEPTGQSTHRTAALLPFFVIALALLLNAVVVWGAKRMMQLHSRGLSVAAAILAMIALPAVLIGLAMGIWALVVLGRREVVEAFAAVKASDESASAGHPPSSHARLWCVLLVASIAASWLWYLLSDGEVHLATPVMLTLGGTALLLIVLRKWKTLVVVIVGLPVLLGLLSSILLPTKPWVRDLQLGATAEPASRPAAQAAPAFSATLSSGVTVELVGVLEHPSQGKSWWRPDGEPLPNPPYKRFNNTGTITPSDKEYAYEFAIALGGIVNIDDVDFRWEFDPSVHNSSYGEAVGGGGRIIRGLLAVAALVPASADHVTVTCGLAAGPWHTLAQDKPRGGASVRGPHFAASFSPATVTDKGVVLTVSHNVSDQDVRVVAVDKDGTVVTSASATDNGAKVHQITVTFSDVDLADIERFELQTRPYEWAEFRNVSLRPKEKTALPAAATAPATQPATRPGAGG